MPALDNFYQLLFKSFQTREYYLIISEKFLLRKTNNIFHGFWVFEYLLCGIQKTVQSPSLLKSVLKHQVFFIVLRNSKHSCQKGFQKF